MANTEIEELRRELAQVRQKQAELSTKMPAPPEPVSRELEAAVDRAHAAAEQRWERGEAISRREERSRGLQGQVKPASLPYVMPFQPFQMWRELQEERQAPSRRLQTDYATSGAARMLEPLGAPLLWGQRATAGVPLPKDWRQQASEWYPWSDYGQKMVAQTPASVMEQRVANELGAAGMYWFGLRAIPKAGLPAVPPRIGLSPAQGGGETIPHEYSHAAQIPWWSKGNEAAFAQDLKSWLFSEPIEEWDEEKRYIWNTWNEKNRVQPGFGTTEVYGYIAATPWLIPANLEKWYPQYDLRSRGQTARPGYRGPGPVPSRFPPPPVSGPRIK